MRRCWRRWGATRTRVMFSSPIEIIVAGSCTVAARVAMPWLARRGVSLEGQPQCAQGPCSFALRADTLRNSHGLFILNATGRYVESGKWYSPLTAPNVSGWEGQITFTSDSSQGCVVRLCICFRTIVGFPVSLNDGDGGTSTRFDSEPGPIVDSNGRLKRDYARAIERLVKGKVPQTAPSPTPAPLPACGSPLPVAHPPPP